MTGLTLHAIIVERSDSGVGVVFEDDPVGVGGDPLLGARVEVVGARVVLVGGPEGDGVLLEAAQDGAAGHEPAQLVRLQHAHPVLDVADDLRPRLLQPEVEVTAPEAHVVTVEDLVALFQWKNFGKVEHGGNLLEVLHPVLDVLLVRGQVGVDEQEGGPEQDEAHSHCALGLKLGAGSRAEAVVLGNAKYFSA